MPTYLIISQSDGASPSFDHITAADLTAAALEAKARYGAGMSVDDKGYRAKILLGIIEFDAVGSITPNVDPAQVQTTYNPRDKQPAIPDLAGGASLAATVAKVNAILGMLRDTRTIDP